MYKPVLLFSIWYIPKPLLNLKWDSKGGDPGLPGSGGKGGNHGRSFGKWFKVLRCDTCGFVCCPSGKDIRWINYSSGKRGRSGYSGPFGRRAVAHSIKGKPSLAFKRDGGSIRLWLQLLKRYASDKLLAMERKDNQAQATSTAVSQVLDTISNYSVGWGVNDHSLRDFTTMVASRLVNGNGYFGGTVFCRSTSELLQKDLEPLQVCNCDFWHYQSDWVGQRSTWYNYWGWYHPVDALRRDLKGQREGYVSAAISLSTEI